MRLIPPILVAAALALILPAFAAAPDVPFRQNAPQPSIPTLQVYSRETILDVLVTDAKGQPVRGLTRADFTILEDGQPVPIRGFAESSATAPAPPPALPPDTFTNAQSLPINGPVQIFLVQRPVVGVAPPVGVFVPAAMLDYLRSMTPGTEVAIFSYCSVTGLELVQGFTTDGNAAAAAAARIQPVVGKDYRGPSEKIFHIAAMEQLAAYVAGIHGRKNLIWMQGVIPMMIDRDGGYEWGGGLGPGGKALPAPDMSIVHRLMDLYEIFSREQIAIYPVDPNGIHVLNMATLRTQEIADQTGGTYDNTNDIKGELAAIVDRSSDLYTLTFVPPRPGEDSRFHSIKILCSRSGVDLTYRAGYDDDTPRPPEGMLKADLQQGPMRLGAIPATQVLFDLHVSQDPVQPASPAAQPARTKGTPYTALFTFDPTQIALTQNPDGTRTANIELDLGAFDSFGKLVVARSQTFKLTVTPAQYAGFYRKPINLSLAIDLPRAQLTLRAGLFDTSANRAGTLEIPVTIPKK